MTYDPYYKPIEPLKNEDRDRLKPSAIEPTRHVEGKETPTSDTEQLKIPSAFAGAFIFFKTFFEAIKRKQSSSKGIVSKDDLLLQDLDKLRLLFEQLRDRDLSQNVEFAQSLSDTWTSLSHHKDKLVAGKAQTSLSIPSLKNVLSAIEAFPERAEHTLGYYLKEHAGKDWLPFPFMELLKKLHIDSLEEKDHSKLSEWIAAIRILMENEAL